MLFLVQSIWVKFMLNTVLTKYLMRKMKCIMWNKSAIIFNIKILTLYQLNFSVFIRAKNNSCVGQHTPLPSSPLSVWAGVRGSYIEKSWLASVCAWPTWVCNNKYLPYLHLCMIWDKNVRCVNTQTIICHLLSLISSIFKPVSGHIFKLVSSVLTEELRVQNKL